MLHRALLTAFTERGYQAALLDENTLSVTLPGGDAMQADIEQWRFHAGRNPMADLPGLAASYADQFAQMMAQIDAHEAGAGRYSTAEDVRVRIYPDDMLTAEMREALVTRPLAPGLWETVVVDYPDAIMPLQRSLLGGESEAAVFGRALAMSLHKEPYDTTTHMLWDVPLLHIHAAHRYIGAPHLHALGRHVPLESAPFGALVALPIPELLLVHVLGGTEPAQAMHAMQAMALQHYEHGDKAITPEVYWWRPGAYERLPEPQALAGGQVPDLRPARVEFVQEDGSDRVTAQIHSDDAFFEMLQRLLTAQSGRS
ncbi:hypothetical protein [Thermomonospora cellulosilytica]|uniref:Uncharacterized protein n=1 Tax=Thermomonospora cellulosilytica TaxID=1411118 RepID=A0A7W3MTU4_9ACTN|nr:hypothetical protein [Thermomonospora cellulosilytica]MBA9001793.1 hypothetical protein [Thermomonospora cellulosilytica]